MSQWKILSAGDQANPPQVGELAQPRPILVGEHNPLSADRRLDLYPDPPGSSGHRLCHRILGLSPAEYLRRYELRNLCGPEGWSLERAIEAMMVLIQHAGQVPLVLLGRRVALAFARVYGCQLADCPPLSILPITSILGQPRGPVIFLPNPSGMSRTWSVAKIEAARDILREHGALW
jgi:hypothetical protein